MPNLKLLKRGQILVWPLYDGTRKSLCNKNKLSTDTHTRVKLLKHGCPCISNFKRALHTLRIKYMMNIFFLFLCPGRISCLMLFIWHSAEHRIVWLIHIIVATITALFMCRVTNYFIMCFCVISVGDKDIYQSTKFGGFCHSLWVLQVKSADLCVCSVLLSQ